MPTKNINLVPTWGSNIFKATALSLGRTGVQNKAGQDIREYIMLLRGNLASGSSRGGPVEI